MNMRYLGKNNPLIKRIKRIHRRRYRELETTFLIEGERLLKEAIKARYPLEAVLITQKHIDHPLTIELTAQGTSVYLITEELMSKITPSTTSQGVLGLAPIPAPLPSVPEGKRALLLDRIHDPGNLGTLIRSAWASQASCVILKGGVDPFNPKVVRATAGGIFHVPLIPYPQWTQAVNRSDFTLVAATPRCAPPLYTINLPPRSLFMIGNEAHGLDPHLFQQADIRVSIPIAPGCESINAAMAGTILLFEHLRTVAYS